jgi:integrase
MSPSRADAPYGGRSFQFTEARVAAARRAARPHDADPPGRRSWRDDSCRGLTLVVNLTSGTAVYYFQGKVNGQTTRRALGEVDVVTLQEAREAVNRLRFDRTVAAVLTPRPAEHGDAEPVDDSPLVGTVAADMLDAHAAGRWLPGNRTRVPTDRTMKFYRDLKAAQLKDHEGLTLRAFAERLPAVYAALQKTAPVQANRLLQLCRNVYAYAASAGLWSRANPAIGDGAARLTRSPEQARTRTLSDAEWKRLDAAMKADAPLWRDLFTVSLLTLQRMGAVCSMRWDDLTLTGADAAWKIPARMMKGRRGGHVVPLAGLPDALDILKARRATVPKDCPWVFPAAEGDGGPARNYDKAWKRILTRAKLWSEDREQRPRPHDLRRTGGARMTSAGVPLQTVTRALGDAPSSVSMVARTYAQVADEALKDAFAATAKRSPRRR